MIRYFLLATAIPLLIQNTALQKQQSELHRYTARPPRQLIDWTIGIRTGISKELSRSDSFLAPKEITSYSWSQEVFLQKQFGKHFTIEMQAMHQSSNRNLIGLKSFPDRVYSKYISKSNRIHNGALFGYVYPKGKVSAFIGVGMGFLATMEQIDETHAQAGGPFINSKNTSLYFDSPNLIAAITLKYRLSETISLDSQWRYSSLSPAELSHLSWNIGVGVKF